MRHRAAIDSERLKGLQASANDTAAHVVNVFIFFLTYGLYLAVTVGATTHEQLLRSAPVSLPILGVNIPLFGFYWIAPALFVLLHFNLTLQFYLLARKLREFEDELAPLTEDAQREYLTGLNTFAFSHMLIGRHHSWLFRTLFRLIVWITVIILPVILLLGVQVRFLPYHDPWTTTAHRFLVLLDLLLLLVIWPQVVHTPRSKIAARNKSSPLDTFLTRRLARSGRDTVFAALAVFMGLSSLFLFTFPADDPSDRKLGDPMEEKLLVWLQSNDDDIEDDAKKHDKYWRIYLLDDGERPFGEREQPRAFLPTSYLFEAFPNVLSRSLKVAETNLVTVWPTKEQIEDFGEDEAWQNFGGAIVLQGRDLRYGDFGDSTLVHANLRGANLQGAVLQNAKLQGADLREAKVLGASLTRANLQGARLEGVNLQGADLLDADLERASLVGVNLQDAFLVGANLQGADLREAELQYAGLMQAELRGADLYGANLQGADLEGADLQGADMGGANLQLAALIGVNLQGASLVGANLQGATLTDVNFQSAPRVNLQGVDLRRARIWGAKLEQRTEQYRLSDLRDLDRNEPSFEEIQQWIKAARSPGKSVRGDTTSQLEKLLQLRAENRAATLPPGLTERSDVLLDLVPPPTLEDFDAKLAGFLINLACAKDAPPSIAERIGLRAAGEEDGRLYPTIVARALLDSESCPPAREISSYLVADLEGLRGADAKTEPEAAREPDAPVPPGR